MARRRVFVYWDPASSFCGTVQIAAGGRYEHTLELRGIPPGQEAPVSFENAQPGGVYRLRVERLRSADGDRELPESYRLSNAFELRVDEG